MTKGQWDAYSKFITDAMKVFTRPFVTPLVSGDAGTPPRIGTGTYIQRQQIELLTCEHVAKHSPIYHQFFECSDLLLYDSTWRMDSHAIDAAVGPIDSATLHSQRSAMPVPISKFGSQHQPVENELLFFRGLAGENAYVGFSGLDKIITGYCSQEKKPYAQDSESFEILWNPQKISVWSGTDQETRERLKHDNPGGFSGSLVWNTRFVELGCNQDGWRPDDAIVTGLLRRWDTNSGTLLAWRVEHLLKWLCQPLPKPAETNT